MNLSKITTLIVGIIYGMSSSAYSAYSIYKRSLQREPTVYEHEENMQTPKRNYLQSGYKSPPLKDAKSMQIQNTDL